MAYIHYEDLNVYKDALVLALLMHKLSLDFPKYEQFGGVADQLRRSSKSICANLAEGLSKQMSAADKAKFVWLTFCHELGYMPPDLTQKYRQEYQYISQMLYNLQKSFFNKPKALSHG
jgi:four helix bundle protein